MRRTDTTTIDDLLEHRDFIRLQARRLVGEQPLMDDIEQQTWLTVLQRPPRHAEGLRAWLALVVRSIALRSFRTEDRRAQRERRAHLDNEILRTEGEDASWDDSLRSTLERELEGLDAKYREVLRQRYFHDRATQEISEFLGIPRETVRTRLKRGLAQLRSRMDRSDSGARAALGWGLLFPRDPGGVSRWCERGPRRWMLLATAAATLVAVPLLVAGFGGGPAAPGAQRVAAREVATASPQTLTASAPRRERLDLNVPAVHVPPASTPAASVTPRVLNGSVLDVAGQPVAGAEVLVSRPGRPHESEVACTTGSDGCFRLEDVDPRSWIGARRGAAEHSQLVSIHNPQRAVVLDLRRLPAVRGLLRDRAGRPISGARVTRNRASSAVQVSLDGELRIEASIATVTDADGAFELPAPNLELPVTIEKEGYVRHVGTLHFEPETPEIVTLDAGRTLRGSVLGPDRRPLPGTRIVLTGADPADVRRALTRDDGSFEVTGLAGSEYGLIASAAQAGVGLHARTQIAAGEALELTWNATLAPGGALSGVALDADGAPLAEWWVSLAERDLVPHGAFHDLILGRDGRSWTRTDAAGRFLFTGLNDARVDLALAPERAGERAAHVYLAGVDVEGGAEGVVLQVAAAEKVDAELRARFQAPDGAALAGAVLVRGGGLARARRVVFEPGAEVVVGGLAAGTYRVAVWPAGGTLRPAFEVTLGCGERRDLGIVELEPTGSLELEVRASDGGPATAVRVGVVARGPSGLRFSANAGTRARGIEFHGEGRVTLSDLPPGQYMIWVARRKHARFTCEIVVEPGVHAALPVQLATGSSQRFHVRMPDALGARRESVVRMDVFDAQGRLMAAAKPLERADLRPDLDFVRSLAAGDYRAVATLERGGVPLARGAVNFTVDRAKQRPAGLALELEPVAPLVVSSASKDEPWTRTAAQRQ